MTIFKRISNYLISRLNWLVLVAGFQGFLVILAVLDPDLSVESVMYVILCNVIFTCVFLIFSYHYETGFNKKLAEMKEVEELKHKEAANTPMDEEVLNYLFVMIQRQKQIVSKQAVQLKEHEQSLTEFVHEIKTPLTALKLMIDHEEDTQRRNALLFEWSRMNEMLDQQLYIARLSQKHQDLYFEQVSLKRMVIEEIQLTRNICRQRGIGFDLNFEADDDVFTDMKWCKMMIRQILSNAVKYSEAGTEISITSKQIEGHSVLEIKDTGRGILSQDLPRIFERGFTSTKHRHETISSGLGLYLVDQIKRPLHIQVTVKSVSNEGTTVTFVFPKQNEMLERMSEVTKSSL
ncbi:sensor histidine kinase [Staphylococcus simulans]|uniref:sensor histidine kinase n=1 Tax=Staphylococcus simulans TaxID=1286 RepID=UPI003999D99F